MAAYAVTGCTSTFTLVETAVSFVFLSVFQDLSLSLSFIAFVMFGHASMLLCGGERSRSACCVLPLIS